MKKVDIQDFEDLKSYIEIMEAERKERIYHMKLLAVNILLLLVTVRFYEINYDFFVFLSLFISLPLAIYVLKITRKSFF